MRLGGIHRPDKPTQSWRLPPNSCVFKNPIPFERWLPEGKGRLHFAFLRFLMHGSRFCFLTRTKQACLFVWRKRARKCCGCTIQAVCQTFTKSSVIKSRCYDKLPNLPYKRQQWLIDNYSSSHLDCFPASGSSVGLAHALNQALALPIISVTVADPTRWRSSSAFALGQRREREKYHRQKGVHCTRYSQKEQKVLWEMEDEEAQKILELHPHTGPAAHKRLTKPTIKFINAEVLHYHYKITK